MTNQDNVQVRRVYASPLPTDGTRVLVDRLWPRGVSKESAHLDAWDRTIAPSTALRKWYGHAPERYEEFASRYRLELQDPERAQRLVDLRRLAQSGPLTLLTAAKRSDISEATVIAQVLRESPADDSTR